MTLLGIILLVLCLLFLIFIILRSPNVQQKRKRAKRNGKL